MRPASRPDTVRLELKSPLLAERGERVVRHGDALIPEESIPWFADCLFVIPNEADNWRQLRAFGPVKKGAVISVGSFRALNDSLLVDGTTFVLDIDPRTTEFTRGLIDLIRIAKNRHELLAMLLKQDPKSVQAPRVPSRAADEAFLQSLEAGAAQRQGVNDPNLPAPARAFHSYIESVGSNPRWDAQYRWSLPRLAQSLRSYAKTDARWAATFLGSDEAFARVKAKAMHGQIVPVKGSLTGKSTMRALNVALRRSGEKVAAFDFSNAMDYLTSEQLRLLSHYVGSMPTRRDAKVLLSGNYRVSRQTDGWDYYLASLPAFRQATEQAALDTATPGGSYRGGPRYRQRLIPTHFEHLKLEG